MTPLLLVFLISVPYCYSTVENFVDEQFYLGIGYQKDTPSGRTPIASIVGGGSLSTQVVPFKKGRTRSSAANPVSVEFLPTGSSVYHRLDLITVTGTTAIKDDVELVKCDNGKVTVKYYKEAVFVLREYTPVKKGNEITHYWMTNTKDWTVGQYLEYHVKNARRQTGGTGRSARPAKGR